MNTAQIPEEATWLHDTVSQWLQTQEPQFDEITVFWCLEKLCLSGLSLKEALQTLGIMSMTDNINLG